MSNYRKDERYQSNPYPYADTMYGPYPTQPRQQGVLAEISDFARRQPLVTMAAAVVGGLLLARYLSNQRPATHFDGEQSGYRPMWSYAPSQPTAANWQPPREQRRPADHMGATEDQMSDKFAQPSRHELEQGAKGTTGTIYDLDPDSITAG